MTKKHPLVSIVILNWNGIDDTLECLESIRKLTYPSFEVIVVDNGSKDNSVEVLRSIKDIVLVESATNTGFAGGHNLGYLHATGEYIALLNNDLVVAPDWLDELMNCITSHNADIAGGRSYAWDETQDKFQEGAFSSYQTVNPTTGHTVMLQSGETVTEANNLSGSNLLVSRHTIETVGYLDSDFFCYYEETDFIARAKRAGLTALYCPTAKTWHKSGASSRSIPFFYFYQMHRNRFWFAFKNYDRAALYKFLAYYTKEMIGALKTNRRHKNLHDSAMIKAYFTNIRYLPQLMAKRMRTQQLGSTYTGLILRETEGFDDVTVIVPCYNYGNYVRETLDSLEAQTLKPAKVIIINDGSTDNSAEVISQYIKDREAAHSSILYQFIDKSNKGVIATKNLALDLVTTTWMMFLDADDTLDPRYIYKCVTRARKDNSDIVYTDMQMFGVADTIQTVMKFNSKLLRSVNFVHNSALMRTAIFKQAGGYKQKMSIGFEDWELYLSISEITSRFSYIPEPIFNYRRHEGASRDISAQTKLPQVIKNLEEIHPNLYNLPFFWWLELYRAKNHAKELLKVPLHLAKHTKSHMVKHALRHPTTPHGRMIMKVRNSIKKDKGIENL